MITRIELDGFKTFQDFSLDLAPLQVFVGANGAGKSNLFDALRLLERLALSDLASAFHEMRGQVGELFTVRPGGRRATQMRLAVELLVARQVQDSWGTTRELTYPRLRYELVIERRDGAQGQDAIALKREALGPRHDRGPLPPHFNRTRKRRAGHHSAPGWRQRSAQDRRRTGEADSPERHSDRRVSPRPGSGL